MKDLAVQYKLGPAGPGTSAVKFLTALQDVEDTRQRDVLALNVISTIPLVFFIECSPKRRTRAR